MKLPIILISATKKTQTIFLNNYLKERLNRMRLNYNQRCKRKFLKRKYSHQNSENIRHFYEGLNTTVDPKLYEIKFHSSFALYLYLYLKSKAVGYEDDNPADFTISQPISVNLNRISLQAGIARNTVKAALNELIQLGIVYSNPAIPLSKNKVKQCLVLNSEYLLGYDENEHKIIYSHCSVDNGFSS